MLTELEQGLIDVVNGSALKAHLRTVDSMPDITPETIRNLVGTAPAVYVVAESVEFDGHRARGILSVLCLAKNSRGHQAQRRGDGDAIGLYEIVSSVAALAGPGSRNSYKALRVRLDRDAAWRQLGLAAAVFRVESSVTVPDMPLDYHEFLTFSNTQQVGDADTDDLNIEINYPQE
jgi:hypothetical protein